MDMRVLSGVLRMGAYPLSRGRRLALYGGVATARCGWSELLG